MFRRSESSLKERAGYKSLNRRGVKTREWERARHQLKTEFLKLGITFCELSYAGCWMDDGLGFAHPLKRRHLKPDQLKDVILACNHCHDVIERLSEEEMSRIVYAVINNRLTKLDA